MPLRTTGREQIWKPCPGMHEGECGEVHPSLFTRAGAQRWGDREARKSTKQSGRGLTWVAFVSDCGEYWRVNIGAKC